MRACLAAVLALLLAACAAPGAVAPVAADEVGEIWPGYGILKGYLAPSELPDSLALLPRPPLEGTAAFAEDLAGFRELGAFRPTARGKVALDDADLSYPHAVGTFSCALGMRISEADSPNLAMLMRRTQGDAALAPQAAKNRYRRARPFAVLHTPSCVPGEEAALATDGSYPSGHASVGWAWALVLAEIAPERGDALLQRGRAYAQSRAICGVHWKSDIEAGRLVGAATVARLHASPVFRAQSEAARREIASARARASVPPGDCAAEAEALAPTLGLGP